MRYIFLALGLLTLDAQQVVAATCEGAALLQEGYSVEVQEVFDGDTLLLDNKQRLRLIGINAPERARDKTSQFGAAPAQPFAEEAKKMLITLVRKGLLLINGLEDRDKYDRLLAHPFTPEGKNITSAMLEAGYGFAVTIAPSVRFSDCYFAAEELARRERRGVWSSDFFAPLDTTAFVQTQPGGFVFATGKIEAVHASRRAVWAQFVGQLALMIRHSDMPNFYNTSSWEGQEAIVRGWVVDRGEDTKPWQKRWIMVISHPAMIDLSP